MLWSKAAGAGGTLGGGGGLSFSPNQTDHVYGQTSITLPSSGVEGDIAVLTYTAVQGQALTVPTGWTEVTYTAATGSFRQFQRVIVKVLEAGDLGQTLTLSGVSVVYGYGQIYLATFTPSAAVTTLYTSSVDEDFSTSAALPTRTKDTTQYDPPNIVFAMASNYNSNLSIPVFSGGFWSEDFLSNDTFVSLAVSYEIQADANTDRDVTASLSGASLICHSFVLNAE